MSKKQMRLLKLIGMVGLVWFLLSEINLKESIAAFQNINYLILIPIALYIPGLLISTYKWQAIIPGNFWYLFRVYWIGNFFSNFLPSTIGGDGYRVLAYGKQVGKKVVLASVLIDRLSGILGTIVIFLILLIPTWQYMFMSEIGISLSLPFYVWIVALVTLLIIAPILYRKLISLWKSKLGGVFSQLNVSWLKISVLSIVYPILGGISLWVYCLMFGYLINPIIVVGFYLLIQLISILPISFNAIGVYEVSVIALLSLVGVPTEVGLTISLLSRVVLLMQTSIGGVIYMLQPESGKLNTLSE